MDQARLPEGRPVAWDPYFRLMADPEGVRYVRCGDSAPSPQRSRVPTLDHTG